MKQKSLQDKRKIDYNRVAMILVEAVWLGDQRTAEKWGITTRTIINYRNRLVVDKKLSEIFIHKNEVFTNDWAAGIPSAIRAAISFLQEAAMKADPKDPAVIHAVAGALKMLAEVGLTKEVIDARLGRGYRADGSAHNEVVSGLPSGD